MEDVSSEEYESSYEESYEETSEGEASELLDEDDESSEEPKLKYRRLGASVGDILKRDVASCMAVTERFLVLGTHWGMVYVLDFNGNQIQSFSAHSATVNNVTVDLTGEYFASCSDDGKVAVYGLYSKDVVEYQFGRPVLAVALEPMYGKSKLRRFVSGGRAGKLILSRKGFLGLGKKNVELTNKNEGAIRAIAWQGNFIAWTNDYAVKIHDIEAEEAITRIERPSGQWRPELYRCSLFWLSDTQLVIGWANFIKVGEVKPRVNPAPGEPAHVVHIISNLALDSVVCGLAPFGRYIVLLAYGEEEEEVDAGSNSNSNAGSKSSHQRTVLVPLRPELRVLDPGLNQDEFIDISSDTLPIEGYQKYKATDYRLYSLRFESLYYIVSPKDIVVATPRDLDDHIAWLIERRRFSKAYDDAESNARQLVSHTLVQVGELMLQSYMDQGDYTTCAANCPRVLQRDSALWEKWIYKFTKNLQVSAIADYIPVGNPQLPKLVYEIVLKHFLQYDHARFLRTVREWPPSLYEVPNVITAVLTRLRHMQDQTPTERNEDSAAGISASDANDVDTLSNALAELYSYIKQYDQTLEIYLRLRRGNPFQLIQRHNLFSKMRDKVLLLMNFDRDQALELLLNHVDQIPVDLVVEQLREYPQLQHVYLDAVFRRDHALGQRWHPLQVKLYADYDYPKLLPFLKQSRSVRPEEALRICKARELYPEMVYILGNTGDRMEALRILLEKMKSVKDAIAFILEHDPKDDELWEFLISESLNDPTTIAALLENIGGAENVDPIKLIQRIPNDMDIPGLRDRLVKIISDFNLVQSLREGCNVILQSDSVQLQERLNMQQRLPVRVSPDNVCSQCGGWVISNLPNTRKTDEDSVIVYFCGHIFHARCIFSTSADGTATVATAPGSGSGGVDEAGSAMNDNNAVDSLGVERAPRTFKVTKELLEREKDNLYCHLCHTRKHGRGKSRRAKRR